MAVTYVGTSLVSHSHASSANFASVASHASTLIDDILIAMCAVKVIPDTSTNVIIPPDGTWTEIFQGANDCSDDATDSHQYALFWKRATADGSASYTFTQTDSSTECRFSNISTWRGAVTSGSPLDATAAGETEEPANRTNVIFPAFNPTEIDSHIIFMAFYGEDGKTFAAAMSVDTNPDCTLRFDIGSDGGTAPNTDITFACTSGDTTDGANIASRTWSSGASTAGNTGVVFALKPAAASTGQPMNRRWEGVAQISGGMGTV